MDGQPAKLRVGSRVPIATGSFQAGVGVGTTSVNPLVNTQFTYLDVGVNVDITPRVHPNHEVSLKVSIEVSQVTGTATIGGIPAQIMYAGSAPGLVSGVMQVNLAIPAEVPAGAAIPIVITVGSASTQARVTLAIR